MTDARFPERWLNDRRLLRLTDSEFRTFVLTLAWSVSNRTDGWLSHDDLDLIPRVSGEATRGLVRHGLWTEASGGWQVSEFAVTQTSAHELQVLDNARRRDRQKKARQRSARPSPPGSPGDCPPGQDPGTAQERQGKDRPGEDVLHDHDGDEQWSSEVGTPAGVPTKRGQGSPLGSAEPPPRRREPFRREPYDDAVDEMYERA